MESDQKTFAASLLAKAKDDCAKHGVWTLTINYGVFVNVLKVLTALFILFWTSHNMHLSKIILNGVEEFMWTTIKTDLLDHVESKRLWIFGIKALAFWHCCCYVVAIACSYYIISFLSLNVTQIEAETVSLTGSPKAVICEAVQKFHCQLLVMGSRCQGRIKRFA